MTALVRAELLKVRTTRAWWGFVAALIGLTAVAVAAETGTADAARRASEEFQRGLVDAAGIAALIGVILGITVVTNEFRHGTVTPTFLATPRRERVLAAKGVAAAAIAVAFVLACLAVVAAIAVPWLAGAGVELELTGRELAVHALKALLGAVLWTVMGVVVGSAVHSQVAALVGTLIWIFVAEALLGGLLGLVDIGGTADYLPFRALDAADGTGGAGDLSYERGLVASLAWIGAIGAAGVARTHRRDIS